MGETELELIEVIELEQDTNDFYDTYEQSLEDDEISIEEEGFMAGYERD